MLNLNMAKFVGWYKFANNAYDQRQLQGPGPFLFLSPFLSAVLFNHKNNISFK